MNDDRRNGTRYGSGREGERQGSSPGQMSGVRRQLVKRRRSRTHSPRERQPLPDNSREKPRGKKDSSGGSRDRYERPAERRDSYGGVGLVGREKIREGLSNRDFTNGGESSRSGRERDFIKGGDYETYREVRKPSQVLNSGRARSRSPGFSRIV